LLLLSACATPYQLSGLRGGQQPTWLKDGVLEVSSSGNGYSTDEDVRELALLRAAESAIEADYRYFVEIKAEDRGIEVSMPRYGYRISEEGYVVQDFGMVTGSTPVHMPAVDVTFQMYKEKPEQAAGPVLDAFVVYNDLGARFIDDFEPKAPPAS
jgi:hypothetical protein